jgi:hypothetical protein
VRDGGALWLLRSVGARSSSRQLVPLLILASGTWWAIHPADSNPLPDPPQPEQAASPRLTRLLPATNPDPR